VEKARKSPFQDFVRVDEKEEHIGMNPHTVHGIAIYLKIP
jgi:hypothetical protein